MHGIGKRPSHAKLELLGARFVTTLARTFRARPGDPMSAWKKCTGKNRDGKCVAKNHLGHKKVWGVWYGQVPDPTLSRVELQRNNREQPKPKKKRKKRWWE